jgi:hypothetical protein
MKWVNTLRDFMDSSLKNVLKIRFYNKTENQFSKRVSKRVLESDLLKAGSQSGFSKGSYQKRVLKSEFSKACSRKRVLESELSEASSQKLVLESKFSTVSSQKQVLRGEFSKECSQK